MSRIESKLPRQVKAAGRRIAKLLDGVHNGVKSPVTTFHASHYTRINQRRLEHLASLRLPIAGASVLELAAGIGDLTGFFADRGCAVVSTEGRPENLAVLRQRYPSLEVRLLDLDNPVHLGRSFDIVFCYGALYHLSRPSEAIDFMAECCRHMLLLDTCVSLGQEPLLNPITEPSEDPSQSITGQGCRPTRSWVYQRLKRLFPYVYIPRTQPCHEDYVLDWTVPPAPSVPYTRAVFIASRQPLDNPLLADEFLQRHVPPG